MNEKLRPRVKTRVLRVVTLASSKGRYGGPFDTALRQGKIAEKLGFSVTLLAGKERGDEIAAANLNIQAELPTVARMLPTKDFTAFFSLSMLRNILVHTRKSDVVHISLAREAIPIFGLLVATVMHKSTIVQPHGMLSARSSLIHKAVDIPLRPLVRRAHKVVALTDREALELQQLYGPLRCTVEVLGNPVPDEVSEQASIPARANQAIFIARLHPRKRVNHFVTSAAIAYERGWKEEYVVVGPDAGDLETVNRAVTKYPNFSYEGALPGQEVTNRLARSSVFVLTSQSEPWGNVLATALALGVPVVIPSSAALSSVVSAYGAGRVYDDGNCDALADAIHELLSDRVAHETARQNALKLTKEQLSRSALEKRLANLYKFA